MALSGTRLRRRHIAPLVLAAAALPLTGLGWSTWQLLAQDRQLERRQRQERLDRAENQIVGASDGDGKVGRRPCRRRTGVNVGCRNRHPARPEPPRAPADRIAFLPVPKALPHQPPDARAAALLPRGRELAAAGRHDAALQVFDELRGRPAFSIDGTPSWLAARYDRLSRLVESLLDFGRLVAGTQQYEFAPQDCAALVQSVVDDFSGHAANAGYRITLDACQSATVNVDAEAFSRALWNLLDNAMKYSPANSTIEVGVRAAHGTVCIDVRDRGIGVGPGESRDIFRRFHRGAEPRSRRIRGTGLGLAMVVEIMQAHGGRVDLESQLGQGSTFTLVLPPAA